MAKKFFYVCAGLLCITVALSLEFRAVHAQSVNVSYFAGIGGAGAAVVGRTILMVTNQAPSPVPFPPVPGTADIASVMIYNAGYTPPATTVVLANGDVYNRDIGSWVFMGSFGGSPTPAKTESWGQLKARFR